MRNHHPPPQRLITLASLQCFIIFKALLLNVQLAEADSINGTSSCYNTALHPACPMFQNTSILFPFFTSQACGLASSLVLSGCDSARNKPSWPNFHKATIIPGSNSPSPPFDPSVMGFYQPASDRFINSSNNFKIYRNLTNSGSINLTWSNTLIPQNACESLVSLNNISHYLPQSINLTSFAHSSFQLSPSNIILLFNCSSTSPSSASLEKNSSACRSYETDCIKLPKEEIHHNCYQYTPESMSRELHVYRAMKSLHCEYAMFFVVRQLSTPASRWSPFLIELNWSTSSNPWMALNMELCEGCLQSNGACGYDDSDNFLCYCANDTSHSSNCPADNKPNLSPVTGNCNNGLWCSTVGKIGIGGAIFAIMSILVALFWYCRTKKIVPLKLAKGTVRHSTWFGSSGFILSHRDLDELMERPTEYQFASIAFATKHFSNLLGEGGFGAVYKGTLGNSNTDVCIQIAVKVLAVRSKHSKKQFCNELAAIGRIHHVHVVRLLGFCIEENHEMLVYEYVSNGSLDKWLFHQRGIPKQALLWEQRQAIALGVAKGLSYLHEECRHRIVHCDIKPQNILLDEKMWPKIADFGLAKLMGREESRIVTLARGTPGYIAPEFWMGGESQLSTKSDVYSYGMVVLELISGQQNFGDGMCFPEKAFEAAMGGNYKSIMDVKLGIAKSTDDDFIIPDNMQWQQIRTALLVALWCIQDHPMNRPSMGEVVQYLEGKAAIHEDPPRPTIASTISISAQQHLYLSDIGLYGGDITPISGGR